MGKDKREGRDVKGVGKGFFLFVSQRDTQIEETDTEHIKILPSRNSRSYQGNTLLLRVFRPLRINLPFNLIPFIIFTDK